MTINFHPEPWHFALGFALVGIGLTVLAVASFNLHRQYKSALWLRSDLIRQVDFEKGTFTASSPSPHPG